ncbi:hypothetical protein ABVT39_016163 [Epinephelus coioides]
MDTRQVAVCSTIHRVYNDKTGKVNKLVKTDAGFQRQQFDCPTPVMEYNRCMGGVDHSDQLIQYYSVQHKTYRWCWHLLYHFLDIATTNSYILNKELRKEKPTMPELTHKEFMETLVAELWEVPLHIPPPKASDRHLPVPCCDPGCNPQAALPPRDASSLCCVPRWKRSRETRERKNKGQRTHHGSARLVMSPSAYR